MIRRIVNNFYLRNLAAWFLYISPDLFQDMAAIERNGIAYLLKDISGLTAFFMFFVFHSRVLYEKLFLKKKYLLYAISFMVVIFVWRESTSYLIWLATSPPGETTYYITELKEYNWAFWVFVYWADVVYTGIALSVYLAFKYFKKQEQLLQAANVQKELELKQLNEQLNPHFLFNALNNIYSHILQNSGDGKELILKLSELMRYILDSNKEKVVPLNKEIWFIEHYIAFEKERLGKRCVINYTKNINTPDFNIVPLILFNFIENAFKHGTSSIQRSEVSIHIEATREHLELIVTNPVYNEAAHSMQIGHNNVRKRLGLLYPSKHKLDITHENNTYKVILELQNINDA